MLFSGSVNFSFLSFFFFSEVRNIGEKMIFACEQRAGKLCEVDSLLFTGKDSCVTSSSVALCYGCEG